MTDTPTTPRNRPAQGSIRAGQQLQGRYNLINRIATGGMGEVWRARDVRTGTLVAAKVLRPELTGEEISLSRLRIEARNAMRAHHPNIAAVLDSGESDGQGWIVMELVQGDPLTDFVGDGKRLNPRELIPILSQTAFALDGAAQAGIIHRDIKPANIMVRADGMVKLTDFGISYTAGQANLTAVGMVMGTAQYLAPEQAMGAVATHAGDLYALGIIAYEALAGYRPFTGKTVVDIAMAHVNEPVPALPDDVPEPLAELVYWLLAKAPEDRPASGTALVRSLGQVAHSLGQTTQPVPLTRRSVPEGSSAGPTTQPASEKTPPPVPGSRAARHRHLESSPIQDVPQREAPAASAPEVASHPRVTTQESAPGTSAETPGSPSLGSSPRPRPIARDWRPVTADSAAFARARRGAESPIPQSIAPKSRPSVTRPSVSEPEAPPARELGTAASGSPASASGSPHAGRPLPRRAQLRRSTPSQNAPSQRRGWIALGLIIVGIVLILIALFSNNAQSSALDFNSTVSIASTHPEVEPWLTPIPVY